MTARPEIGVARQEDIPAVQQLPESMRGIWQHDWHEDAVRRAVAAPGELGSVAPVRGNVAGGWLAGDALANTTENEADAAPLWRPAYSPVRHAGRKAPAARVNDPTR
jgi:hypothetical protein